MESSVLLVHSLFYVFSYKLYLHAKCYKFVMDIKWNKFFLKIEDRMI